MLAPAFPQLNRFAPQLPRFETGPTVQHRPQFNPASGAIAPTEVAPVQAPGQDERISRSAGNILNFVHKQLAQDVEAGASTEDLQARFEAGLKGFRQGFVQALDELDESGLLSPDLKAELNATRDKVLQGFASMADEFGLNAEGLSDTAQPANSPAPVEVPGVMGVRGFSYGRNDFSFSLTTQEGDIVTITSSSEFGQAGAIRAGGVSYTQRQSDSFSFTVEGDLNESELAALNDLLDQVNDLNALFYSGDLTGAFEAAGSLSFDAEQIAGYALNLRQTTVSKVQRAYGQPEASPLRARMQPFGQMADSIAQALNHAKQFDSPLKLLANMMDQLAAGFEPEDRSGQHKLFNDVGKHMAERLMNV